MKETFLQEEQETPQQKVQRLLFIYDADVCKS